jgi:ribonucleoside-diphosphate reductase alpha chain
MAWDKFSNVKKRNGETVEFKPEKIGSAIRKAILSTRGNTSNIDVNALTEHVLKGIEVQYKGYKTPDVEGIQNLVERTLMEFGLFDVAKAYILYRERHREIREQRQKEIIKEIESGKISVTKRDGSKEVFSNAKLRAHVARACAGFEGVVDIDYLVRSIEAGIYEGIKTSDLAKLAIMSAKAMIEKDPTSYETITTRLFLASLYKEALNPGFSKDINESYSKSFPNSIKKGVEQGLLAKELLQFDLEKLSRILILERDMLMNSRGIQTLYDRYFIKDKKTSLPIETPQFFWMRVAMGLSINEKDRDSKAMKFYEMISSLRFVPSTPTLFHSGTVKPQLSSCYLTTVEDDLTHIFKSIGDNAQLSKWSGGLGNDWTNIRATGSLIKSTNVESQGVIPFLKIANDTTVAINRSGKRRGATCAYLETWHLDIEDFLDLRKSTGDERRRTHDMDTANWIPDLFMKRVMENSDWTLFSPDEVPELHHTYGKKFEEKYTEYEHKAAKGEIRLFKTVKAQTLWRKMITSLFETGHPWIVFKDPANVRSPQDHVGVVHSSNLCTEITLNTSKDETAVCNLGSINLAKHISNGEVNKDILKDTVITAMRMLDNVIDLNYYPTVESKNSNMKHRPVGLGIMGYQDALYSISKNFDSKEALDFSDEIMEFISYYAILASSELAKERGVYETFKGSKWDRGILPIDTLDLLEQERGMKIGVPRTSKMDWEVIRESIRKHGMRNSNTLALAPTATISNIAGCYPSIEPIYKNIYVKSNMSGEFTVVNTFLVEDLKANELWNKTMLEKIKEKDGNLQQIESIPKALKDKYKEAFDIDPEWMIESAARRAKWIDQSQSLNIFSATSSGKRLSDIYLYAWKMGLKSTYYLRTIAASTIEKSTLEITNRTAPIVIETETKTIGETEPKRQPSSYTYLPSENPASKEKTTTDNNPIQVPPISVQAEEEPSSNRIAEAVEPIQQQDFDLQSKVCRIDGRVMGEDEECEACQ